MCSTTATQLLVTTTIDEIFTDVKPVYGSLVATISHDHSNAASNPQGICSLSSIDLKLSRVSREREIKHMVC